MIFSTRSNSNSNAFKAWKFERESEKTIKLFSNTNNTEAALFQLLPSRKRNRNGN